MRLAQRLNRPQAGVLQFKSKAMEDCEAPSNSDTELEAGNRLASICPLIGARIRRVFDASPGSM